MGINDGASALPSKWRSEEEKVSRRMVRKFLIVVTEVKEHFGFLIGPHRSVDANSKKIFLGLAMTHVKTIFSWHCRVFCVTAINHCYSFG